MAATNKDTGMMITILGPTATGKTGLAAIVAQRLSGEIISADSRQVYRGMDIGTGKDYEDYVVNGETVAHHLIDIIDPGYEYNVFEFQEDFVKAFNDITSREKLPILCGGTGLYIEAVLSGYKLIKVPENPRLRLSLENKSLDELRLILGSYRKLHNITDITDHHRAVRAIEIQEYEKQNPGNKTNFPKINSIIFGVLIERQYVRERITNRLKARLESGMVDEVKHLLDSGLKPEQLGFYGLEYRFLTDYVTGKISYQEMFRLLNTAIHQFAKRQMTWFRRMEKRGFKIHWIDGNLPVEEKVNTIVDFVKK
jgi:tRNA dimethylallyltransferase